jgi:GTPase Era involved in 16S rRNA processing
VSEVVEGNPEVAGRVSALQAALQAGGGRLDPDAVRRARAVLDRTGERMTLGAEHTVVALVGATGSGKSSLFNALAGMDISEVGARRPTTNHPSACVWGTSGADPLLDWLQIAASHRTVRESILDADRQQRLHGLVLIDLPDHDSRDVTHRLQVDRLVDLVDLLVWVVDPQKYADEALHSGYLRKLVGHQDVMIVVLNQIDRLGPAETLTCMRDLARLLEADGLRGVRVLATSATSGEGVEELREVLAELVQNRSVVNGRAAADLAAAATELARGTAEANGAEPDVRLQGSETLIDALSAAAGVPALLDAVEADYRRRASARVTWPFLRLASWLRPDPLRTLHLGAVEDDLRRLAQPALLATPAERARVDLAVHEVVAGAAEHLPTRWADAVRAAAPPPGDHLADQLDAAVRDVDLGLRTPVWWRVVFAIQMLFAAAAVVGFVWLAAVGLTGWLGLPTSTPPEVAGLPLPTLLFGAGLIAGLLVAAVCRPLVVSGGRRRRGRVAARLEEAISGVADRSVLAPVTAVLDEHRRTREALIGAG